jgi:hypothetical protein
VTRTDSGEADVAAFRKRLATSKEGDDARYALAGASILSSLDLGFVRSSDLGAPLLPSGVEPQEGNTGDGIGDAPWLQNGWEGHIPGSNGAQILLNSFGSELVKSSDSFASGLRQAMNSVGHQQARSSDMVKQEPTQAANKIAAKRKPRRQAGGRRAPGSGISLASTLPAVPPERSFTRKAVALKPGAEQEEEPEEEELEAEETDAPSLDESNGLEGSSRVVHPVPKNATEKQAQRILRNRDSAERTRLRRLGKINALEEENERLRKELDEVNSQSRGGGPGPLQHVELERENSQLRIELEVVRARVQTLTQLLTGRAEGERPAPADPDPAPDQASALAPADPPIREAVVQQAVNFVAAPAVRQAAAAPGGIQKIQEYLGKKMGATAVELTTALQRAGLLSAEDGRRR